MTGIDLALAALNVSGIYKGVVPIGVPSCSKVVSNEADKQTWKGPSYLLTHVEGV
jgi:hypothetical protein